MCARVVPRPYCDSNYYGMPIQSMGQGGVTGGRIDHLLERGASKTASLCWLRPGGRLSPTK